MFNLSIDKLKKDQWKANIANAYIGYWEKGTSTYQYSLDAINQSIPINDNIIINNNIICFVSVNWNNILSKENEKKTKGQILRVLSWWGVIVMDGDNYAYTQWNKNWEWKIQTYLWKPTGQKNGYNYWRIKEKPLLYFNSKSNLVTSINNLMFSPIEVTNKIKHLLSTGYKAIDSKEYNKIINSKSYSYS